MYSTPHSSPYDGDCKTLALAASAAVPPKMISVSPELLKPTTDIVKNPDGLGSLGILCKSLLVAMAKELKP